MQSELRLQARIVDTVKRSALALLHRSAKGEALVLQTYLGLEEHAERSLIERARTHQDSAWLEQQLTQHSADEARHVLMFRNRLLALGATAKPGSTDFLNRWKLSQVRTLVVGAKGHFEAGDIVPVMAVLWRSEIMGLRVFQRHVDVLRKTDALARERPTLAILERVLEDERRHAVGCESLLNRLVQPSERGELKKFLEATDAIERAWSISGAVLMWIVGLLYALPWSVDV